MAYIPRPYEVRTIFWSYLRLLARYNELEIKDFNKSGNGSATYYHSTIERKREYLRKWGHLLTIYQKNTKSHSPWLWAML